MAVERAYDAYRTGERDAALGAPGIEYAWQRYREGEPVAALSPQAWLSELDSAASVSVEAATVWQRNSQGESTVVGGMRLGIYGSEEVPGFAAGPQSVAGNPMDDEPTFRRPGRYQHAE